MALDNYYDSNPPTCMLDRPIAHIFSKSVVFDPYHEPKPDECVWYSGPRRYLAFMFLIYNPHIGAWRLVSTISTYKGARLLQLVSIFDVLFFCNWPNSISLLQDG
jgi:hypothetical protein